MEIETHFQMLPSAIKCVIFDMAGTTVDDLIEGVPLMIIAMIQVRRPLHNFFVALLLMDNFEGF
jgi:hypothetical protein